MKLGIDPLPAAAKPAKAPNMNLPVSDALSILKNGPKNFAGRKVGVLISDGTDMNVLSALRDALEAEGAMMELVGPRVAGIQASDGTMLDAKQAIQGGPSVLYDAVVLLPSQSGAEALSQIPETRDFVADAYAHFKFIGGGKSAQPLLDRAGAKPDGGVMDIVDQSSIDGFIRACRTLRFFDRQV